MRIILKWLYFDDKNGGVVGNQFKGGNPDLRLGEHERHDITLEKLDLDRPTPEDLVSAKTIWFEDTLGRRHKIKDIEKNIRELEKC